MISAQAVWAPHHSNDTVAAPSARTGSVVSDSQTSGDTLDSHGQAGGARTLCESLGARCGAAASLLHLT